MVLRPRANRHKFRLFTGFAAAFLARQVPTSRRRKTAAKTDSRGGTPFRRPLRYRIQAMKISEGRMSQNAGGNSLGLRMNTSPRDAFGS